MLATKLRAAYGVFVRILTQSQVNERDYEELEERIASVRDELFLSQRREGESDAISTATRSQENSTQDNVDVGGQVSVPRSDEGAELRRVRRGSKRRSPA